MTRDSIRVMSAAKNHPNGRYQEHLNIARSMKAPIAGDGSRTRRARVTGLSEDAERNGASLVIGFFASVSLRSVGLAIWTCATPLVPRHGDNRPDHPLRRAA
jgi:hypothetical protein